MDFFSTKNTWGTDEISTSPTGYDSNLFITDSRIKKQMSGGRQNTQPMRTGKVIKKPVPKQKKKNISSFTTPMSDKMYQLSDNHLMIILLVILVVLCALIFNKVHEYNNNIKTLTHVLLTMDSNQINNKIKTLL